MHGWMAYTNRVSDEATLKGKWALVVGLSTIPYVYKVHSVMLPLCFCISQIQVKQCEMAFSVKAEVSRWVLFCCNC